MYVHLSLKYRGRNENPGPGERSGLPCDRAVSLWHCIGLSALLVAVLVFSLTCPFPGADDHTSAGKWNHLQI